MKKNLEYVEPLLRGLLNFTAFGVILAVWPTVMDPAADTKRIFVHWAALIIGYIYLIYQWRGGVRMNYPRLFGKPFAVLLGIYFISTFLSDYFDASFIEASHFLLLFVLYAVASQVYHTLKQAQVFILCVCAGAALASFYGFAQKLGWDPFPWSRLPEVYGGLPATYGNPNFAAHVLVLAIIFVFYLLAIQWGQENGKKRDSSGVALLGLLLATFALHLYFTGQRAAVVALAGAALLLCLGHLVGRRQSTPVRGAVVTMSLSALLALCGAGAATAAARAMTGLPLPLDTSILIRYQSYVSAAHMLFQHPLLGYGPGVYRFEYPQFWRHIEQQWFAQERMLNAHVHNDLMELSIDAGLFCAGAYLLVLVLGMGYGLMVAFREGPRAQKFFGYAMAAFFCAFFIDGLFGFNLRVPASATLFFLACGVFEGMLLPERVPATPENKRFLSKPWRVALIFLLPIVLILQTRVFRSSHDEYMGLRALARQDTKEALNRFRAAEIRTPWNGELSRRQGLVVTGQGMPFEGSIHLARALTKNPHDLLALLSMAQAKMLTAKKFSEEGGHSPEEILGIFAEGRDYGQQVLKISPMDPTAHDVLGRIAALTAMELAKEGGTNDKQAAALWQEAADHLLAALESSPSNKGDLFLMLAEVRTGQQDLEGAEDALTRGVESSPSMPALWDRFQDFAKATGRYDRLQSTIKSQIRRLNRAAAPDKEALATSYVGLGQVLAEGYGDWQQADGAYLEAVAMAPGRADIWAHFGEYVLQHDRPALLKQALDRYAREKAAGPTAEDEPLFLVQRVLADPAALNPASERMIEIFQGVRNLNEAAQQVGWLVQVMARQAQQQPGGLQAQCDAAGNLGILLNLLKDNEKAIEFLRAAQSCANETKRPLLAVHLGDALIQTGDTAQAAEVFRQAAVAYPDNVDVRWAFARGLARIGLKDDSRAAYKALIEEPWLDPRGKAVLQKELDQL